MRLRGAVLPHAGVCVSAVSCAPTPAAFQRRVCGGFTRHSLWTTLRWACGCKSERWRWNSASTASAGCSDGACCRASSLSGCVDDALNLSCRMCSLVLARHALEQVLLRHGRVNKALPLLCEVLRRQRDWHALAAAAARYAHPTASVTHATGCASFCLCFCACCNPPSKHFRRRCGGCGCRRV